MAMKVGEILFVDTNILLTATDRSRERHQAAQRILGASARNCFHLAMSGQIIREYLVVATRPLEVNGLGLSAGDALRNVEEFQRRLVIYDETEAVSRRLCTLVRDAALRGKRIHDANVAATMLIHGISKLVTENPGDFANFAGIEIVNIDDLVE
ncbi:MAG: PIN domain-containing protein [Lentisphaeria bacterium]|nr:PIN domain-containing protein [Lentisphaeria bacterium]